MSDTTSNAHDGNINESNATATSSQKLAFAKIINRLKSTRRTGWTYHNIPNPESVSDHTWRVATLCFLLEDEKGVDVQKCIQMALLHDLAEAVIGDLTPRDNVSSQTKAQLEKEGVLKILSSIQKSPSSSSISKLIDEYEDRNTYESKLVKDFDLLDMILQAEEYETTYNFLNLDEFFVSGCEDNFLTDYGRNLAKELHMSRRLRKEKEKENDDGNNSNGKKEDNIDNAISGMKDEESSSSICKDDEEFIRDFSSSSHLNKFEVESVVKALRMHENKSA